MRGELTLTLSSGLAIVKEVRPLDYKLALIQIMQDGDVLVEDVPGERWDSCWYSLGLIETIGEVNDGDLALVRQGFLSLNRAFFSNETPCKTAVKSPINQRKLSQIERELNHACEILISHNHQNCWQYGWQFFQYCLELYKEK